MFVGHYAASFASKSIRADLPLWLLFVAVQFTDYVWATLIILGIEKARYEPGFTEASPLDLYYMPYTHSLVGALVLSVVFAAAYFMFMKTRDRTRSLMTPAIILGLAVFSHWLTDLLVHVEDLPLVAGEPKFGFGLWRNYWVSQALELGLLALAFIWYMAGTRARNLWGSILPIGLIIVFVGLQAYSHNAPPPPNMTAFAVQALLAYTVFAALAYAVERNRSAKA